MIQSSTLKIDFLQAMQAPYVEQWTGLWAMEPTAFQALAVLVQSTDIAAHLERVQAASGAEGSAARSWRYRQDQSGVAVLSLTGTLQKQRASMSSSTSTVEARRELRAAVGDPEIGAILLAIDSPGGTSAGTQELFDEIRKAATQKPVFAFINDLGASAAYWVASGADFISTNRGGLVGSIGTYAVVQDFSALAAKEGVKVHVVKAGNMKGAGVPGTEVTADQLSEVQRIVNAANSRFLEGVASSRGTKLTQSIETIADGRVHPANEALALGLIDKVQTFEEALQQATVAATDRLRSNSKKGKTQMSVTSKEIKAACPGATADFIVACQDAGRDLASCQSAWMQELATDLAASNEELAKIKAENQSLTKQLEEAKAKTVVATGRAAGGVDLLETNGNGKTEPSADADQYWAKVKEFEKGGSTRQQAMMAVNKLHPELREALLASANKR
jgi:signal peptide peptidase SppA